MRLLSPILVIFVLAACGPRANASSGSSLPPSIQLASAEIFDYQGGELRAHGFADEIFYRRDTGGAKGKATRVELPSRHPAQGGRGGGATWIEAPIADGNPLAQSVDGSGGVTLHTQSGDRGSTEAASYRGREGRAYGQSPLALSGPGYELKAPGFTWNTLDDRLDFGPATLVTRGRAP